MDGTRAADEAVSGRNQRLPSSDHATLAENMEHNRTMTCPKCGGSMEPGVASSLGARPAQVVFIVAGSPTSRNPIEAFKQGTSDEPTDRQFRLSGARCSRCGVVEFYAAGDPTA